MSHGPASSESYWLATAPTFTGGAQGPVAGEVDVAVIGGGFTGLSAAVALRKRGASVAVLEAGRVIGEASGRNGGHCNTGGLRRITRPCVPAWAPSAPRPSTRPMPMRWPASRR
ncbi:choline dehydrogenase-like flavoprotein [Pseudomonas psychrotolerans]|nr:choline dehydrogenase-like flavoprotein [Pseudomonas psychrotolerans]